MFFTLCQPCIVEEFLEAFYFYFKLSCHGIQNPCLTQKIQDEIMHKLTPDQRSHAQTTYVYVFKKRHILNFLSTFFILMLRLCATNDLWRSDRDE